MKKHFSTFDIVKALRIPRNRLKEWLIHGFVQADQAASGAGTKALFTVLDCYAIALFKDLLDRAGINRNRAAHIVTRTMERYKHLRKVYPDFDDGYCLIILTGFLLDDYAIDLIPNSGGYKIDILTGEVYFDSGAGGYKSRTPDDLLPWEGTWRRIELINLGVLWAEVDHALGALGGV